jgi:uncharacterized membrane protein
MVMIVMMVTVAMTVLVMTRSDIMVATVIVMVEMMSVTVLFLHFLPLPCTLRCGWCM